MSKTMTRAELLALAKRVEAEEPSRKLQIRVLQAFGWRAEWNSGFDSHTDIWRSPTGGLVAAINLPDPLTSLDAAVTLVPSGAQKVFVRMYLTGTYVRITTKSGGQVYSEGLGNSALKPAAALTAAALRALAQEQTDDR